MLGCSLYATNLSKFENGQFCFEIARDLSQADVERIGANGKPVETAIEAYRLVVDARESSFDQKAFSHLCYHFLSAGRDLRKIWAVESALKAKLVAKTKRLLANEKTVTKNACWQLVIFPQLLSKHGSETLGKMLYDKIASYSSVSRALEGRTLRGKEGRLLAGKFAFLEFSAHRGKGWEARYTQALEAKLGVWEALSDFDDSTDLDFLLGSDEF